MMRKKRIGIEVDPASAGKDFPDSYYAVTATLVGKISPDFDATSANHLRIERFLDSYKNLELIESEILRKRCAEAIITLGETLRSFKRETKEYISDFESVHGTGRIYNPNGDPVLIRAITHHTKVIGACYTIVEQITCELRKRGENIDGLSVAKGLRDFERDARNEAEAILHAAPLSDDDV